MPTQRERVWASSLMRRSLVWFFSGAWFGFFLCALLILLEIPLTLDLLPVFSVSENVTTIHPVVHASNVGANLYVHQEVLSVLFLRPM